MSTCYIFDTEIYVIIFILSNSFFVLFFKSYVFSNINVKAEHKEIDT